VGTRSDSDMKTKRSDVPIDGLDSVTERRCEHIVLPSLRIPSAADGRYTPVVTFYDTHGFRHLISDQPTPPLPSSTVPAENPVAIDPQLVAAPRTGVAITSGCVWFSKSQVYCTYRYIIQTRRGEVSGVGIMSARAFKRSYDDDDIVFFFCYSRCYNNYYILIERSWLEKVRVKLFLIFLGDKNLTTFTVK